jgi:hypothetical protein
MIWKSNMESRMILRKRAVFFVCILLFSQLAADWKKQAAVQAANEEEYPLLIEFLQKEFAGLPDDEKVVVSLLIGYCHSRMPSAKDELLWMKKHLEELRGGEVDLKFLPPGVRQKVQAFGLSWRRDFPVLWELSPAPEHAEIAFFSPPSVLNLRLQASLPCDYRLFSRDGEALAQGVLGQELQTVKVPLGDDFFKVASHHFRLLLTLRSAPEKTVEKYFAVELHYIFPENVIFDPVKAELKLKGRDLQPETMTETRVISRRTRFDKTTFKKVVLKDLLAGVAFYVVSSTLLTSTIDNPDTSLFAKSALFGTRRVFHLAGFACSLSALCKLPKAFKREKVSEEKSRDLPEARAANEALRHDLERARKSVRVKLAVKPI